MVERERFVPRRVGELSAELAALPFPAEAPPHAADDFAALARGVAALVHVELLEREREVTEAWAVIDDDPAVVPGVVAELDRLAERANFVPLTIDELEAALEDEALVRLRLDVNLEDYEELVMHRRGSRVETFELTRWRGLRSREVTTVVDDRVVVLTRVRPAEWFEERGVDPSERDLVPGATNLKLFRDVPRADIEMLLPATKVRFRRFDTLKVGVPAIASGILALTKLLPVLGFLMVLIGAAVGLRRDTPRVDAETLIFLGGGFYALGYFLYRQWRKVDNRRIKYLKVLSENLYYRTVADGAGVFHTLYASAEEQEIAEILLAYRVLLDAPQGIDVAELNRVVEAFLAADGHHDVDFEVDDALAKLRRLDLVDGPEHRLRAVPLAQALPVLDGHWQDLFRRAEPTVEVPAVDLPAVDPSVAEAPASEVPASDVPA